MKYKGLPILVGIGLVLVNFALHLLFPSAFLTRSNFLLHLGVVIALVGLLIGEVLG